MTPPLALLRLASRHDEAFWRAALDAHGVPAICMPDDGRSVIDSIDADARLHGASALVVDFPVLESVGHATSRLPASLARTVPGMRVFARLPRRARVSPGQRAWARHHGYADLLPGHSPRHAAKSLLPALQAVLEAFGNQTPAEARAHAFLGTLGSGTFPEAHPDVERAFVARAQAEAAGVSRGALAESMRRFRVQGVADRTWRGRSYRQCFVASEAVDWLAEDAGLARPAGVAAGRMLQGFGILHHVAREQAFDDANLFFRFDSDAAGEEQDLAALAVALREGLPVMDRTYLGRTYPGCFVGSDAVDWLVARLGVGIGHAEAIGQRLVDLGVLRHVTDDHDFMDAGYFYTFRAF